jgi:hypothetical protein
MLSTADLEVNVLEFRQRSFQYERSGEVGGTDYAVFGRTETETERKLRPRLVHLLLVVPRGWIVLDEGSDLLRVAREGTPDPPSTAPVVEIAADPSEFREGGAEWVRTSRTSETLVYLPKGSAPELLTDDARDRLGVP